MDKGVARIAIVTFANLPLPAVKGGAVETLIDNLCEINEIEKNLRFDIYSVEDAMAKQREEFFLHTDYHYYHLLKNGKLNIKNIVYKITGISIMSLTMKRVISQINKEKYDCVIVTGIIRELYCITMACKAPVVWYLHGDAVEVLGVQECRKIGSRCKAVISVSNFVSKRMEQTGATTRFFVVNNCTDIKPINGDDYITFRTKYRQCFKIGDETVYAYVGRLTPIKGVLELVRAFTRIRMENAKLLIVGQASEQEEGYLKQMKDLSNEHVIFAGYVAHHKLNELLCAVDVVVIPSICNEAAPLSLVEAQVCGKPVIAADMGGIPEYAEPDMTLLVEGGNGFEKRLEGALKQFENHKTTYKIQNNIKFTKQQFYNNFCKAIIAIKEL